MLADKLYQLASFRRQYQAILILSARENISALNSEDNQGDIVSLIDWNNVLGIASALCQSEDSRHLDAALRIAQTCISSSSCNEAQKSAAAYVLETLTNRLAIKMSLERQYIDGNYADLFSVQQKLDVSRIIFSSSIFINDRQYLLNRFQSEVYRRYSDSDAISISAPTSAGKSYILCAIITEALSKGIINIIYIVPTRALISQVESDLTCHIQENGLKDRVNISTVPLMLNEFDAQKSNIFVFTQERLHWFLINNQDDSIGVDLMIVDEAHKIEDGNRGILLQQKIEELIGKKEDMRIYFSSPFTSNPELLLDNIQSNRRKGIVNTQFVAVNQNLIYVTPVKRKPKCWAVALQTETNSYSLGNITLENKPVSELDKMALVAQKIGEDGSCIIYSNGPADAENIAKKLYKSIERQVEDVELQELIKLVKDTISVKYKLAEVLQKGIAFHYGNMPLLIRREIERLFAKGKIHYLVCTSTLLEGMNLPAKSIIIRKPCRGRSQPLNANDFWNLAGRAGRWGKEFCGNIVCIEPYEWPEPPNPNKTKQKIVRAIDSVVNRQEEFLKYIESDSRERRENLAFESAIGYYYIKYIIDREDCINDEFHTRLLAVLHEWSNRIKLPAYIIKRNPGISPLVQQNLLEYFEKHCDDIADYVPVNPRCEDAVDEYEKFVHRIGETLTNSYLPALDKSRAILLVNWMNGYPLAYLIKKSYESYQKRGRFDKTIDIVIREVMDHIETFARFSFAKYSSCYIDVLRYFLEIQKRMDLIGKIPQLNLWLEFGVSEKTHLSLLSLGLSRNTVIALTKYMRDNQMSKQESLDWLRGLDLEELEISPIMKEDIKRIV